MLIEPTLNTLRALRLTGMAQALADQYAQPDIQALSFEERLSLAVDREVTHRANLRLAGLLRRAHLRQQACIEDIDFRHPRGLERSQMASLATGDFIRQHHNLMITGPTGCGKSWLACALGQQACRLGLSVRYWRASRLIESLRIARADGSYSKILAHLAKIDLLILDDFALEPLQQNDRQDLLEIVEDRHLLKSMLMTSQLPTKHWHDYIGVPTLADAILDRLLHNTHHLSLTGESMRKNDLKHKKIDLS